VTIFTFSSQLMNGPNKLVLHYITLEELTRDKQSSLLDPFVRKKMKCRDDSSDQCYKTSFGRNLLTFLISQSVRPQQVFPALFNVCG
jgi:hypothetical protein